MVYELDTLTALRYVQPLREGGSLPAVVDTEDGPFVVKFRGAGQGPRVLVAEIIVAHLAAALDLPVPEMALVEVDPAFGRSEPDPEIQDLLRASHGINLGMRFLDGAFNFSPAAAGNLIDPELAARIVWLDAFVTNPDRTARNPNMLIWQRRPWLIDHGAALYAHHDWARVDDARVRTPFPLIREHVLLTRADDLLAVDAMAAAKLTGEIIRGAVATVPDDLLGGETDAGSPIPPQAARERYVSYLARRLEEPRAFVTAAIEARAARLAEPPRPLSIRR